MHHSAICSTALPHSMELVGLCPVVVSGELLHFAIFGRKGAFPNLSLLRVGSVEHGGPLLGEPGPD